MTTQSEVLDAVTSIVAAGPASTTELVAALRDSGALRMLPPEPQPRDIDEFITVVCELAALDGSAGWVTAMFNAAAHVVGDHDALVTGGYQAQGRLTGGLDRTLTGRWESVVGAEYADWLLLTADQCFVLVPRSAAHVEPIRDSTGLRAAGLCDVTVSDMPVGEHRIFENTCDKGVVGAAAAAAVVGSADGAWRIHVDQVRERLAASYGSEEVTDQTSSTAAVARAASDIDAAKLQIATSIQLSDAGPDGFRAAAWAHRQAAVRARDAADQLLGSSRRHALDASDPVTRLWQDVHAGCLLTIRLLDGLDAG